MVRPALFALTGISFFAFWALARPAFEATATQQDWPIVLWFSATLLTLAVSLPAFGRLVGGRTVIRLALIAGLGIGLSSVANIIEDGLQLDWAFFGFILGTLIMHVCLLALTVVIAFTGQGMGRFLALIPAGTFLGVTFFVAAGGIILLVTWLVAAAASVARERTTIFAARRG
ncbi:MAG: hypothetical protein ACRDMH_18810 [Solirubrobacterales bacterium]